ncbi:MAG: NAD(+)/NADH kinase [Ruminococcus sp.]|nr:NAD(+)/NADH kinase [Ruminococcus sp.]
MFKVAIFHNSLKNNADMCALQVVDILHNHGIEVFADVERTDFYKNKPYIHFGNFLSVAKSCDVVIAIGGDGTILQCAKYIIGSDTQLLGINTGRLGFMASVELSQLDALNRLPLREYNVIPRMLLKVSLSDGSTFEALNDVSIVRQYSKIFDFSINLGKVHIGSYRADGVIFSTPTGSTAYSLSAGGSIIEPDAQCIEMVLVSPHFLGTRPMIFSPNKILTFSHSCLDGDIYFSVDGNTPINLAKDVSITIEKSQHSINIIDMMDNTFYVSLNEKLNKIKL